MFGRRSSTTLRNVREAQCTATKGLSAKSCTLYRINSVPECPSSSSICGRQNDCPASSRNLRSWPPLWNFSAPITFAPMTRVVDGNPRRSTASLGSSGVTQKPLPLSLCSSSANPFAAILRCQDESGDAVALPLEDPPDELDEDVSDPGEEVLDPDREGASRRPSVAAPPTPSFPSAQHRRPHRCPQDRYMGRRRGPRFSCRGPKARQAAPRGPPSPRARFSRQQRASP